MNNIMKKVRFTYEINENQADLFTRAHVRYKCKIIYNGRQYTFDYQCNPSYTKVNKKDCIECLLSDASCFKCAYSVDDFLREFGYDDSLENIRKGERAFKACEKTHKALTRVFGDDLETLREEIENV